MSYQKIETTKEFFAALRSGPYTSVGGYPLYFVTKSCDVLSFKAAKENALQIGRALRDDDDTRWQATFVAINYESLLYCEDSGEQIATAYGVADDN